MVLGFSLSWANMEDREPERREKSADTGRYWGGGGGASQLLSLASLMSELFKVKFKNKILLFN